MITHAIRTSPARLRLLSACLLTLPLICSSLQASETNAVTLEEENALFSGADSRAPANSDQPAEKSAPTETTDASRTEDSAATAEAEPQAAKETSTSTSAADNPGEAESDKQNEAESGKQSAAESGKQSAATEGEELPKAKSVNLAEPVARDELVSVDEEEEKASADSDKRAQPLRLLGAKVEPATATRLAWSPSQFFEGLSSPTPVLVVNGAQDGPVLCLTAAIHGDELNGIEIVRRVLYGLEPEKLTGAVIGVPIVNLQGFRRNSRYLDDRRDLNRYFPGNVSGSSASRIAHSFFNDVIRHCDVLVDLHTGSFERVNLPQLRADLRNKKIAELTHNFGATVVLHSEGAQGTLRRAAAEQGIPAVTLEAGGPMRLETEAVDHGVAALETLLDSLGMIKQFRLWGKPEPVYYQSNWVRVDQGGILFSEVKLGQSVTEGQVLGTVTDPITNVRHTVVSPHKGRVLGMALNQVMLPGYAAYHLGIAAESDSDAVPEEGSEQPEEANDNEQPATTAPENTSSETTDTEREQTAAAVKGETEDNSRAREGSDTATVSSDSDELAAKTRD